MIYRGMCMSCRHRHDDELGLTITRPGMLPHQVHTCGAFPQGIPDDIFRLGFDHRQEYPGDRGVRYEHAGPVDLEQFERRTAAAAELFGNRSLRPEILSWHELELELRQRRDELAQELASQYDDDEELEDAIDEIIEREADKWL